MGNKTFSPLTAKFVQTKSKCKVLATCNSNRNGIDTIDYYYILDSEIPSIVSSQTPFELTSYIVKHNWGSEIKMYANIQDYFGQKGAWVYADEISVDSLDVIIQEINQELNS